MEEKIRGSLGFLPRHFISETEGGAGGGGHQRVQPNLMPLHYVKIRNLIFARLFILWKILLRYFSCSLKKKNLQVLLQVGEGSLVHLLFKLI